MLQKHVVHLLLVCSLLLGGCQARERTEATQSVADKPPDPGSLPTPSTATREGTPADAVRRYYAAIDARRYRDAYDLWGQGGAASGKTFDEFAQGFDETAHVWVEIVDPVRTEGAAGSIFADVPVVVQATTNDGAQQQFVGTYTMRRVNDVPGATPEQLRWHIQSASLEPAP